MSPPLRARWSVVSDFQRSAVYRAEDLVRGLFDHAAGVHQVDVFGVGLTLPPEARFGSVESVQAYIDRVLEPGTVRVRRRAGARSAHYEIAPGATPVIAVPDGFDGAWALRELVVLHEVAHHLADTAIAAAGSAADGAHGPRFTAAMIDLASRVMGPPAGLALRIVYTESGALIG